MAIRMLAMFNSYHVPKGDPKKAIVP